MFRKKTIGRDGLYAVWKQSIHRKALLETVIALWIIGMVALIVYWLGIR